VLHTRLLAGLLALGLAMGAGTQPAPCQTATQPAPDLALNRHIELMVRSHFSVPRDIEISVGERKPSAMPGYDALAVTLSHGENRTAIDFLLSTDKQTLVRLEALSLAHDPASSIDVSGRPVRGNPDAKVSIIVFDDLECPVCARTHHALFPATLDRYKDKVRFIYKDNPLMELHPWAMHAAVDANCLAAQSGPVYWAYLDYLHSHGQEITGVDRNPAKSYAALDRIAREVAGPATASPAVPAAAVIDRSKLDTCLTGQDETGVHTSLKEAEALGLNFAPAVYVNGDRIEGFIPEEQIWRIIDRALRDAGEAPAVAPSR